MQAMKQDPRQHAKYIKGFQARLYLDPDVMRHARVKTYRAHPLTPQQEAEYKTDLRQLVRQAVRSRLKKSTLFPVESFRGASEKPKLVRQLEMLDQSENFAEYGLVTEAPDDWVVKIPLLIQNNKVDALVSLLLTTLDLDLTKDYIDYGFSQVLRNEKLLDLFKGEIAIQMYDALRGHKETYPHIDTVYHQIQEEVFMQFVC